MTRCLIVIVGLLLSTETAGHPFDGKHVGIMLPWLGRVETDGSSMGSSFMIAMKRYNYSVPFAVMPFRCDRQRSVIAEVINAWLFNVNIHVVTETTYHFKHVY